MTTSNINRIVTGDPKDPESLRHLEGISKKEFNHILLALLSGISECQIFERIPDESIQQMGEAAKEMLEENGLPDICTDYSPEEMREGYSKRLPVLLNLHNSWANLPREKVMNLGSITPEQYGEFITSLQGAYREAIIFSSMTPKQVRHGIEVFKRQFEEWGLPAPTHYDSFLDNSVQFFERRQEILHSILEAVNQPFPGLEYPVMKVVE